MATVALQNAVERAELGAATAALNFVRSLAGTIFVGVFGALLSTKLGAGSSQDSLSTAAIGEQSALAQTSNRVLRDVGRLCFIPARALAARSGHSVQ